MLQDVKIPRMVKIQQHFNTDEIQDVEGAVQEELRKPEIMNRVKAGMRIAVGVGSRGVAEIPRIVRTVISELKSWGAEPFIVPAMEVMAVLRMKDKKKYWRI
jgi:hypothetical protein